MNIVKTIVNYTLVQLLEKFNPTRNIRQIKNYNTEDLAEDISENGAKEMCLVNSTSGHGIQGHRRVFAYQHIFETNPARFAELFKNGKIPVEEISVTVEEEIFLLVDQGQRQGIVDIVEAYFAIRALHNIKMPESGVYTRLRGYLQTQRKLEGKRLAEYNAATTDAGRAAACQDFWRGRVQPYYYMAGLPDCVESAWVDWENGEETATIKVGTGDMRKLNTAFNADLKDAKLGVVTKKNPGAKFKTAWQVVIDASKNATKKEKAKSAKSRKDQLAMVPELNFSGSHALISLTSGEEVVSDTLTELDQEAFIMVDEFKRLNPVEYATKLADLTEQSNNSAKVQAEAEAEVKKSA